MTDRNYTHVTLVVDRSGSMQTVRTDAQGAINQYIADQRNQAGRLTFTLIEFDGVIDTVADFQPIAAVSDYQLKPRGMTALFDAVGHAITSTGTRLAAHRRGGELVPGVDSRFSEGCDRRAAGQVWVGVLVPRRGCSCLDRPCAGHPLHRGLHRRRRRDAVRVRGSVPVDDDDAGWWRLRHSCHHVTPRANVGAGAPGRRT